MDQPTAPTEAQAETATPQAVEPAMVEVNTLDTFINALMAWHSRKVASLKHMGTMPEGIEIEVQVDGGEPTKLAGDKLEGFKFGISFTLNELGTLPFAVEMEDDDSDEAVANATAAG